MPFLRVTTWPMSDETSVELISALTATVHQVTKAPLDKIIVIIDEIPQDRWGEAGAMGSNKDFAVLSRKR